MDEFRFRKFAIAHAQSTMRVGTDAVLLGSFTRVDINVRKILDVGTGCGIIALMLAQRTDALIDAIDVDEQTILEANSNFRSSPWSSRLNVQQVSFQDFAKSTSNDYDLIVSNPPFFQNSLLPKSEKLKLAKHNQQLGFESFLTATDVLLFKGGKFAIILPVIESESFLRQAGIKGFFMVNNCSVIPVSGKNPNRNIMMFSREEVKPVIGQIILRNSKGKFSEEYKQLTKDFHPEEYFA